MLTKACGETVRLSARLSPKQVSMKQEALSLSFGVAHETLLTKWRHAPVGDPMFQEETGEYFAKVLGKKRRGVGNAEHVRISKSIG